MQLTIRSVTAGDRAVWEELFRGYAAFYETDPAPAIEAVWGWILDLDEPFRADIAISPESGAAVGLVQYQLMHRSLSGGMVCYLSDLFVRPELRGTGAGRAMIDHVIGFARAQGLPSVRWLTAESNAVARGLYDSYAPASGFILYAVPV